MMCHPSLEAAAKIVAFDDLNDIIKRGYKRQ